MNLKDHYQSTLLGCAIGDALGMPVESWKKEQIRKYAGKITDFLAPVLVKDENGNLVQQDEFGKLRYWTRDFQKGEYTDDTILTIALAESLVAQRGFDLEDIAKRQAAEYTKRLQPDGTVFGGFGWTTIDGFKNLLAGKSPYESGVIGGPGNAPAMKMAPLGLWMHATMSLEKGLHFAHLVGNITHRDPRSLASGVVQAYAISSLLEGIDRNSFLRETTSLCTSVEQETPADYPLAERGTLLERLEWIAENRDVSADEAHRYLKSNSLVFCSYPFALFMFQKYWDNPVEGLIETVNYGGDCDTTGAIFGALAGARHGLCWPEHWATGVQDSARLQEIGGQLYTLNEK